MSVHGPPRPTCVSKTHTRKYGSTTLPGTGRMTGSRDDPQSDCTLNYTEKNYGRSNVTKTVTRRPQTSLPVSVSNSGPARARDPSYNRPPHQETTEGSREARKDGRGGTGRQVEDSTGRGKDGNTHQRGRTHGGLTCEGGTPSRPTGVTPRGGGGPPLLRGEETG